MTMPFPVDAEVEQSIALFTQGIAKPEVAASYGLTNSNTLIARLRVA